MDAVFDELPTVGDGRADARREIARLRTAAITCVLLGLAALSIDRPVARFCQGTAFPQELQRLLSHSENFGHGYGVAWLVVTLLVVDVGQRPQTWRIVATAFGAGLAANLLKLCLSRLRPYDADLDAPIWQTFVGLLPWIEAKTAYLTSAGMHSFPSAHAATATGLAIGLTRQYPRGRWCFLALLVLVVMHRLYTRNHFVSDTLWGTAVGCGTALVVFHHPLVRTWLNVLVPDEPRPLRVPLLPT